MKEQIKDFILSVGANDSSSALDAFNDIMSQKVYDAIESRRQEVSGTMFQEVDCLDEALTPGQLRDLGRGQRPAALSKEALKRKKYVRDLGDLMREIEPQNPISDVVLKKIMKKLEQLKEETELNEVDKKYYAQAKAIVSKKYPGFELGSLGLGKNGVLNVEIIRTKDGFTKEFTMNVKD